MRNIKATYYLSLLRRATSRVGRNCLRFLSGLRPFVDVLISVGLLYFAFSTDRIYQKIADVQKMQTDILNAQNSPTFVGWVEPLIEKDRRLGERVVLEDTGSQISEVRACLINFFTVEVVQTEKPIERFPNQKFRVGKTVLESFWLRSPWENDHNNRGSEIFDAEQKIDLQGLASDLAERVRLEKKFGPFYSYTFAYRHYFSIQYRDKLKRHFQKYLEVTPFGISDLPKVNGSYKFSELDIGEVDDELNIRRGLWVLDNLAKKGMPPKKTLPLKIVEDPASCYTPKLELSRETEVFLSSQQFHNSPQTLTSVRPK